MITIHVEPEEKAKLEGVPGGLMLGGCVRLLDQHQLASLFGEASQPPEKAHAEKIGGERAPLGDQGL